MNGGDVQQKFLGERVSAVEKQFSDLSQSLSAMMRKSARLRDKTDEFAQMLRLHGFAEKVCTKWSQGFLNLSNALTLLADARDMEVKRLERKLLPDIVQYDAICRTVRDEVKVSGALRQRSFADPKVSDLGELAESFEKRRLNDTRRIFLEFLAIELAMHAKSTEVLSAVYQDVMEIDDEANLEEFREKMNSQEPSEGVLLQKIRSQSMGALNYSAKRQTQPTLVTPRELVTDSETLKSARKSETLNKAASLDVLQCNESIFGSESDSGTSEQEDEVTVDPRSEKFKSKLAQLIRKP
ncbi:CBY1-interacting BAR domain-containing protein homolog [Phlebotomus argentipes]|uniref:CBY1-interacting BAR domain-containing protein homolog n=1 Tax=Phlebotomus argentipes TaxID=94469 RepID=UPI0028931388|nr:CBY1-interacting BAR domain-containing protein homolog [Phlebotomus argentipes]